ncbi:MAG TPA: hypothetical protein PKW90_24675 [Myxococcota bacterium]|nr:hypothetical protein [Myxococcota bacterium]
MTPLTKAAEELSQAEEKRERKIGLNKETAKAGLKAMVAAGLGTAAGVPLHMGAKWGLEQLGWPKQQSSQRLVAALGALGAAVPIGYAINQRLNREYLQDVYERSQAEPTGALRVGGA